MKNKFSKSTILLITATIILLMVSFTYYFLYSDITKTKINNKNLSDALESDIQKNIELETIQKNLKLTISDSQSLDSFFVKEDSIVDFITMVENTAKKSGLKIATKNIDSKSRPELDSISKGIIDINIETVGNWQNTIQFLKLLENLPYKIEIISADLSFGEFGDPVEVSEKSSVPTGYKNWKASVDFEVIKTK